MNAVWGRSYFALQAIAGAAWWVGVFTLPLVREATLGELDPQLVALFDLPLFVVASGLAALGVRWAAVLATVWTVLVAVALTGYATITGLAGWGVLAMIAATAGSIAALSLVLRGRLPSELLLRGPFAFRPAASRASPARHLGATAVQAGLFWGLLLGVVPLAIAALEERWGLAVALPEGLSTWARGAGLALLVLATALGIASAAALATRGDGTPLPSAMPNRLVVAGPYRVVRNPMAVAGIAQGVAVGLLLTSWLVVGYAMAGAVIWHLLVRPPEEADLEARFGEPYRRYRGAVRCWVPRLRPVPAVR